MVIGGRIVGGSLSSSRAAVSFLSNPLSPQDNNDATSQGPFRHRTHCAPSGCVLHAPVFREVPASGSSASDAKRRQHSWAGFSVVRTTGLSSSPGVFRFRKELASVALAIGISVFLIYALPIADYLADWSALADIATGLAASLSFLFIAISTAVSSFRIRETGAPSVGTHPHPDPRRTGIVNPLTALMLVGVLCLCSLEWYLHRDDRNPFLASSRPEANEDTWLTADGYAMILDGHIAQNDGTFLLPMLRMFTGDAPPEPSEMDRRAGHLYLVALLERPFGTYWAFAVANLLAWGTASLSLFWLGSRFWPGTSVGLVGSALVATSQGFIFMGTAPQGHAVAYGAFALLLVLHANLFDGTQRGSLRSAIRLGWATGAGGLIYFVHIPFLLFVWLATPIRTHWRGMAAATLVTIGPLACWELVGTSLGLSFTGGNNDLSREAVVNWMSLLRGGLQDIASWGHFSSPRGVLVGAFWYPWWILAAIGWWKSPRIARNWAMVVLIAAFAPALLFTTRFQLPRVAFFAYPGMLLLVAVGIDEVAKLGSRMISTFGFGNGPVSRTVYMAVVMTLLIALATVTNRDLITGSLRFAVNFHYALGTEW